MKTPSLSLLTLPRAVLFDYDGVLVASEPIHLLAWKQLLLSLGLPENLELIHKSIGNTAPKILEALLNLHRPGWSKAEYNLDDLALKKKRYLSHSGANTFSPLPWRPGWTKMAP